jgi:hypothetical protein
MLLTIVRKLMPVDTLHSGAQAILRCGHSLAFAHEAYPRLKSAGHLAQTQMLTRLKTYLTHACRVIERSAPIEVRLAVCTEPPFDRNPDRLLIQILSLTFYLQLHGLAYRTADILARMIGDLTTGFPANDISRYNAKVYLDTRHAILKMLNEGSLEVNGRDPRERVNVSFNVRAALLGDCAAQLLFQEVVPFPGLFGRGA